MSTARQTLAQIAAQCGQGLPMPPAAENDAVFAQPWQAQALSQAIAHAQARGDTDDGHTYYVHWVDALQAMVQRKGLGQTSEWQALEQAWTRAAARTPHGQPIELLPQDLPPI